MAKLSVQDVVQVVSKWPKRQREELLDELEELELERLTAAARRTAKSKGWTEDDVNRAVAEVRYGR